MVPKAQTSTRATTIPMMSTMRRVLVDCVSWGLGIGGGDGGEQELASLRMMRASALEIDSITARRYVSDSPSRTAATSHSLPLLMSIDRELRAAEHRVRFSERRLQQRKGGPQGKYNYRKVLFGRESIPNPIIVLHTVIAR